MWLKRLSEIAVPIISVPGVQGDEPLNWELHRVWDFQRQLFVRPQGGDLKQAVNAGWYRRSDRCDYFSVSQNGSVDWWGWSKTWALLRAYALAGEVPFSQAGRRSLRTDAVHTYLPLPLARALAITGLFLPGPSATGTKNFSYFYAFPNAEIRRRTMVSLWSVSTAMPEISPAAPSVDLGLLWRESMTYCPDALPVPVLLRNKLAANPLLRRFATLPSVPRRVLPVLLSLTSSPGGPKE